MLTRILETKKNKNKIATSNDENFEHLICYLFIYFFGFFFLGMLHLQKSAYIHMLN